MDKFWQMAIGVAGLGGVACFVFWSLFKGWFKLPLFQQLTQKQLFRLFVLFFVLTFLFALAGLWVYSQSARVASLREENAAILQSRYNNARVRFDNNKKGLLSQKAGASEKEASEIEERLRAQQDVETHFDALTKEVLEAVMRGQAVRGQDNTKRLQDLFRSSPAIKAFPDEQDRELFELDCRSRLPTDEANWMDKWWST